MFHLSAAIPLQEALEWTFVRGVSLRERIEKEALKRLFARRQYFQALYEIDLNMCNLVPSSINTEDDEIGVIFDVSHQTTTK